MCLLWAIFAFAVTLLSCCIPSHTFFVNMYNTAHYQILEVDNIHLFLL